MFRLLLLLTRRRLLALRLRRPLLLLLHLLRLLARRRLLAPLLLNCRPIVDRRPIWLHVRRRCIGAVACGYAVRLGVGRLRIRAVIVGAHRGWAIVPLIVWPVVVGWRRSRLIIHRRTIQLHVSRPLGVRRRGIRPIVLRSIAPFATRTHVVPRLIRAVARIILRLRRLRIRPVVVGARRSWAIVPLIVWPVVVGWRSRLTIHRRTVWLHVSRPLGVQRRRIQPIVLRGILRSIAPFATRTHIVLRLTRPIARIVLRLRRPRWGRHPHGCRNGFLQRLDLSCLGNGKRLPSILPDGNLLPFH